MVAPGYDPEDIDNALAARLSDRDIAEFLSEDEQARWEAGEHLTDLLDSDDVHRLCEQADIDVEQ